MVVGVRAGRRRGSCVAGDAGGAPRRQCRRRLLPGGGAASAGGPAFVWGPFLSADAVLAVRRGGGAGIQRSVLVGRALLECCRRSAPGGDLGGHCSAALGRVT